MLLDGVVGPSLSANFLTASQAAQVAGSIVVGPNCPTITFTRASTATSGLYTDATGSSYTTYANNIARLMPQGYLSEQASANYLLNSDTPATQTVTLPTGSFTTWVIGSGSAVVSLGTALGTGAGTATAGTPNTITITTGGTVVVTVVGSLTRFQLEPLSFPTSYITTTGSAATRAADGAYTTGVGRISSASGTIAVSAQFPGGWTESHNGSSEIFAVGSSYYANISMQIPNLSNTLVFYVYNTSFQGAVNPSGTLVGGNTFTFGMTYNAASAMIGGVLNNGVVSNTVVPSFPLINILQIGGGTTCGRGPAMNGFIRKMAYYNYVKGNNKLRYLAP
jgi:hypothetical protein